MIEEAIFLGTLKLCQMLDWPIVFKTRPLVLALHTKSSRKQRPNHLRSVKCVAMYIHVWGSEYMSMQTWQDIYSGGIHLFWMQIKLQQSFVETLLLGNLCLLCNLVGLLYIACDGTVYLLDWGFMRTCTSIGINLHGQWRRSIRCAGERLRLWFGLKCAEVLRKDFIFTFPSWLIITFCSSVLWA